METGVEVCAWEEDEEDEETDEDEDDVAGFLLEALLAVLG